MSGMSQAGEQQLAVAISQLTGLSADMAEVKSTMNKLAEAVTKLAVVEAHQANDRQALARVFHEVEQHEGRIRSLEQAQPLQSQSSDLVRKAAALILAAVLGAGVSGVLHQRDVIPPLLERRQPSDDQTGPKGAR